MCLVYIKLKHKGIYYIRSLYKFINFYIKDSNAMYLLYTTCFCQKVFDLLLAFSKGHVSSMTFVYIAFLLELPC